MPNLTNWFQTSGKKFGWAFDTTPLCCPSRASIFTGQYAHNTGVMTDDLAAQIDTSQTAECYLSQQQGSDGLTYRAAIFGKYLNDFDVAGGAQPPCFNDYAVYNNGPHQADGRTCSSTTPSNGAPVEGMSCVDEKGSAPGPIPGNPYETTYLANKVASFVSGANSANPDQPWFLVVTPTVPHAPFFPESTYSGISTPPFTGDASTGYFETEPGSADFLRGKPPYDRNLQSPHVCQGPTTGAVTLAVSTKDLYRQCILDDRNAMFRMLKSMDDLVGSIKNSVVSSGELANTLALYISDNGYLWGQHWLNAKPYPYTESVRVPFFMSGYGVPIPGTDNSRMVANIDIAPTAMAAAGLSAPQMDGRNLLSDFQRNHILLERPARQPLSEAPSSANNPPLWASIRTLPTGSFLNVPNPYQYIETYASSTPGIYNSAIDKIVITPGLDPTWSEFYKLGMDPAELTNVYGDNLAYDAGTPPDDPEFPNPRGSTTPLHDQLVRDLGCIGTTPGDPNACP